MMPTVKGLPAAVRRISSSFAQDKAHEASSRLIQEVPTFSEAVRNLWISLSASRSRSGLAVISSPVTDMEMCLIRAFGHRKQMSSLVCDTQKHSFVTHCRRLIELPTPSSCKGHKNGGAVTPFPRDFLTSKP